MVSSYLSLSWTSCCQMKPGVLGSWEANYKTTNWVDSVFESYWDCIAWTTGVGLSFCRDPNARASLIESYDLQTMSRTELLTWVGSCRARQTSWDAPRPRFLICQMRLVLICWPCCFSMSSSHWDWLIYLMYYRVITVITVVFWFDQGSLDPRQRVDAAWESPSQGFTECPRPREREAQGISRHLKASVWLQSGPRAS